MDDLKPGDLVRRKSDDLLMEVEHIVETVACCHVVEPFLPQRKLFIALDSLVLEPREAQS